MPKLGEIRENRRKELELAESSSIEQFKEMNDYHLKMDEAFQQDGVKKLEELEKEYEERFKSFFLKEQEILENGPVCTLEDEKEAQKIVQLMIDYLDKLPRKEQEEWKKTTEMMIFSGELQHTILGIKPLSIPLESHTDKILEICPLQEHLVKIDGAQDDRACYLYNPKKVLETIEANLDIFFDIVADPENPKIEDAHAIIKKLVGAESGSGYLNNLRIGVLLGYYRPDVEAYARYTIKLSQWRSKMMDTGLDPEQGIEGGCNFSETEKAWLKLFSRVAMDDASCAFLAKKMIESEQWLPGAETKDESEQLLREIQGAVKNMRFRDEFLSLDFARRLQSIIDKQILEKSSMPRALKDYFLSKRRRNVEGMDWISYGDTKAHELFTMRIKTLMEKSGIKDVLK